MLMPIYTTTTEIQRNFKAVIKKAKNAKDGVIVLSNNNPIGVYIAYNNHIMTEAIRKKAKEDLLSLAGSWTEEEAEEFNKVVDEMNEKIYPEDW